MRRTDKRTGQIYHLRYNPPPPDADWSGKLVQRKDDTEEVVRKRFDEYEDKTAAAARLLQGTRVSPAVNGVGGSTMSRTNRSAVGI